MNIGIIIGRFGDIDGVSLETQKWIDVLRKLGHKTFVLTGSYMKNQANQNIDVTKLPSMSFFSPECEWEQKRAFFYPAEDPEPLLEHLERTSKEIAMKAFEWIMNNDLKMIISENASALPCHLSMGMAVKNLLEHTCIPFIAHDHDFAWERGERYQTPIKEVEEIRDDYFSIQHPNVWHVVINSYAQKSLKEKFNMDSTVIPNVMDFNEPYGQLDNYNRDMAKSFGMRKGDIKLYQVTRIVSRKGIETAIELVDRLDDNRVKLVITGSKADDDRLGYYHELVDMLKEKKLSRRVFFGERRILHYRGKTNNNRKIYSLSDAYADAVACTYFSKYEGFGNAFVEAVLAKKPIFVNNYEPIFWPDIGSKGFKVVMTENNCLTDDHVKEVQEIIYNKSKAQEIAEHNYKIGKKHFSYEVLEELLEGLISSIIK